MYYKKLVPLLILAVLLFNCEPEKTSNQDELINSIIKFNNAFKEADILTLEFMLTDNYVHTNGNSKAFGKESWLSYLKRRKEDITSGKLEVIDYKMSEIETTFHQNTAIVTGKITVVSKKGNQVQKNEYRITNIWVYASGNWKRAGFHDGEIQ